MKELLKLEKLTLLDIQNRLKNNWLDMQKELKELNRFQIELKKINRNINSLEKEHKELMDFLCMK